MVFPYYIIIVRIAVIQFLNLLTILFALHYCFLSLGLPICCAADEVTSRAASVISSRIQMTSLFRVARKSVGQMIKFCYARECFLLLTYSFLESCAAAMDSFASAEASDNVWYL